jgi:hypothetical protein
MAILLPTNLTQDNPLYPTVYFSDIKGNAWATGSDGNQYGIPEAKRELGMIVYFSSSQNFKYYKGNSTSSADWTSPLSWSMFGGGESVNTGSLLLTASATLNAITFTKGDGITQFTITVDTGSGQTYTAGDGIDIDGNNVVSAKLGAGLQFDGSTQIEATVRQVNGQDPDPVTGNISTALTAVETGDSASLIQSSSGAITGSILNGTVWVISGDGDSTKNGDTYIFKSGSAGQWYQISPLDEVAADARYVRLSSTSLQTITSSLLISGSSVTFSSSLYWMSGSNAVFPDNTITASVVVLGHDNKLYITGAYGSGDGSGVPSGPLNSIQYNSASLFSGSANFIFDSIDKVNLTGSLILSGSTPLTAIGGTSRVTGSFIVSSSTNLIGTTNVTGSLIVSSSSQIIGTETITGSLIVSSSSNVIGTSRVTGSLIISNSLQVIGTGSITGSLTISSSTNGQTVLQVTGTGSLTSPPLVQIAGQNGGFVQVYDSNSGSLFSVNSNTGTAIVDVRSNGQTLIGSNTFQGMYDSTANVAFASPSQNLTIPGYLTSSYNALWFDYVVFSGSYSRMGTLYSAWSGSNISYNDVTGSYTGTVPANNITLVTRFSSSFVQVTASAATNNWVIKGMIRCI